ncbi:hypothetical protein HPB47_023922 [Ixodes persulcatus]|uniref:Uncharacterized protein n=1 Tax=Ixodes persulcatus TaxID=34615 RepID=A0AC60Q816_IXOPE|nr:hypothetical protein HPB47_023922 [Ixodes persulcatus]
MYTVIEYAVFGILMICNLGLGLYFAFFKRVANQTTDELFLGSRTLKVLPLAISSFASLASSTGIVGFIGHYYAYGFHFSWGAVAAILVLPVSVYVIIPALFKLKVTSIFERPGSGWPQLGRSLPNAFLFVVGRSELILDGGAVI